MRLAVASKVVGLFSLRQQTMGKYRTNCRSGWWIAVWAGLIAGTLATLLQISLWLLFTNDFPAVLFRDSRLTAALLLGGAVLPPPATFDMVIMLAATLIHFTLSIAYALVLKILAVQLDGINPLLLGFCFGIALYMVNLYGFTLIFPWFSQARGWIALLAHGAFGVAAISVYRWLEFSNAQSPADAH